MSIKTDALPVVTGFGASNEFLVNGPSGTGRMTGATAAGFFDPYFLPENYEGADLTTKFASEIAHYSDVWAWLKARLTAKNVSGLHVKDYIQWTSTDGKVVRSQIAGINQYLRFNDTELSAYHIDFISKDLWPERHVWNKVNYNNGLEGDGNDLPYMVCDLKRWLNAETGAVPAEAGVNLGTEEVDYSTSGVLARVPDALKNVIVEKRVMLSRRFSTEGLLTDDIDWDWAFLGKLWVPAEMEVYGCCVWGTKGYSAGAFMQYPIFRDSKMRIKGNGHNGGRSAWWLLTPHSGNSTSAAFVANNGYASYDGASNESIGAPVCFRIAG